MITILLLFFWLQKGDYYYPYETKKKTYKKPSYHASPFLMGYDRTKDP